MQSSKQIFTIKLVRKKLNMFMYMHILWQWTGQFHTLKMVWVINSRQDVGRKEERKDEEEDRQAKVTAAGWMAVVHPVSPWVGGCNVLLPVSLWVASLLPVSLWFSGWL